MKIAFFLFEQFHGRKDIGSSRIRGHWLCNLWPEAEPFQLGAKYDVIVYQKVYFIEHARMFSGIKILDLCDADWFHWGYRIRQMIDHCDAVTTSTQAIADFISKITDKPVVYIPDRLNFDTFDNLKKEHHGQAKVVGWYGYPENFAMLDSAVGAIVKNRFEELVVISAKPYQLPSSADGRIMLTNIPWTAATVNRDLLKCDIIINPRSSEGRYKYKSNNKTINAWALGLPVAHDVQELKSFIDEQARVDEGNKRYNEVSEKFDVRQSVDQYKKLIEQICQSKNALFATEK